MRPTPALWRFRIVYTVFGAILASVGTDWVIRGPMPSAVVVSIVWLFFIVQLVVLWNDALLIRAVHAHPTFNRLFSDE